MDVKVIIVDDHEIVRQGIRMSLDRVNTNISIVAEASNGQEALDLISQNDLDLIITDISMPKMSGLELTKEIRKKHPHVNVLILSTHNEEKYILSSFEAGALGYLPKDAPVDQIILAIETVVSGEIFYTPEVAKTLAIASIKGKSPSKKALTEREKEILELIVKGQTNKEIASNLFISIRTVDVHRRNIMQKLEVNNTAELVRITLENKYLE